MLVVSSGSDVGRDKTEKSSLGFAPPKTYFGITKEELKKGNGSFGRSAAKYTKPSIEASRSNIKGNQVKNSPFKIGVKNK